VAAQLNEMLFRACRNPSFDRELWIVAGKLVKREALSDGLDNDPPQNRLRQFLMHWDALQTACARASVRLRFFANRRRHRCACAPKCPGGPTTLKALIDNLLDAWIENRGCAGGGRQRVRLREGPSPHRLLHMPFAPENPNLSASHARFSVMSFSGSVGRLWTFDDPMSGSCLGEYPKGAESI
jgi:hypothetical protein